MSNNKAIYNNHLMALHESGFEIVDGEPDIRNWSIVASENQLIGRVSELIFDESSHRVRYLVADIHGKPLNLISRSVIIPMGLAEIDKKENLVMIPVLTVGHLASLPTYEKGKISIDTENTIRSVFTRTDGVVYVGQELADRRNVAEHEYAVDDNLRRSDTAVTGNPSIKEEIRENIIRVKETVKKMERDLEKLD
ncbi:MAG TPA: PRC-barrel domain-containing protein [Puia sp.]